MCEERRVAPVGEHQRANFGDAEPPVGHGEKHHAAVRGQPTAIEGSGDFLGVNGWKENGRIVSLVMAGVAFAVEGDGVGFGNRILRRIRALHHARQPLRRRLANKTG